MGTCADDVDRAGDRCVGVRLPADEVCADWSFSG